MDSKYFSTLFDLVKLCLNLFELRSYAQILCLFHFWSLYNLELYPHFWYQNGKSHSTVASSTTLHQLSLFDSTSFCLTMFNSCSYAQSLRLFCWFLVHTYKCREYPTLDLCPLPRWGEFPTKLESAQINLVYNGLEYHRERFCDFKR